MGEGLKVFLLMTSLPDNFLKLSNSRNGTFLKRLPKMVLSGLNETMIRNEYSDIFDISLEEALKLAQIVKGYPFAYQVLGDILWERDIKMPNERAMRDFDAILDECVYTPIWEHLSETERNVLCAIAYSDDNTIMNVRNALNMQPNHFSPYRERLMTAGLIDTHTFGKVYFTLPRFGDFIKQKTEIMS